jgi:hypothetical protein
MAGEPGAGMAREVLAEMRTSDPPVRYLVGTPKGGLRPARAGVFGAALAKPCEKGWGCRSGLLRGEFLNEADGFLDVLVQTDLLMDDFALCVQNRNDVRVGELACGVLFKFDAE